MLDFVVHADVHLHVLRCLEHCAGTVRERLETQGDASWAVAT